MIESTPMNVDVVTVTELQAQGKVKFQQKQYTEAMEVYLSCVEKVADSNKELLSTLYMNIALCLIAQGKMEQRGNKFQRHTVITEWLTKSLALNSRNVKALYQRAKIFEEMGLVQMAYEDCQKTYCIAENEMEKIAIRKYLQSLKRQSFGKFQKKVTGMKSGIAFCFTDLHLAKLDRLQRQATYDTQLQTRTDLPLTKTKYIFVVTRTTLDHTSVDFIFTQLNAAFHYYSRCRKRLLRGSNTCYSARGPVYPSIQSSMRQKNQHHPKHDSTHESVIFSSVFTSEQNDCKFRNSCTIEQCENPLYIPYDIDRVRMDPLSDIDIITSGESIEVVTTGLKTQKRKRQPRSKPANLWVVFSKHSSLPVPQVLKICITKSDGYEEIRKDAMNHKNLTDGALEVLSKSDECFMVSVSEKSDKKVIWYLEQVGIRRENAQIEQKMSNSEPSAQVTGWMNLDYL